MNKQQAYKILGLTSDATEQDIRKRYKKLAMKVHPDINPDPSAHEEFIRLSLAVERLLKPESEPGTAQRRSRSAQKTDGSASSATDDLKARMDEAKARYEDQKKKNLEENQRYFASLLSGKRWRIYRTIMVIGVILSLCMTLDYFLPRHLEVDTLEGYSAVGHNGIKERKIYMVYLENTGEYFAESNLGTWMSSYPEVQVEKTWLMHCPINFYSSDDFTTSRTNFDFHLLSVRWIIVGVLLVPLIPYFRRRMNIQFVFLYQFSFWMIGLLEVYMLFGHLRIVHLLTLGFL